MISIVQPLHIGNALRLFIEPPAGAVRWRVLRKGSDTFTGPDDDYALVAYEGNDRVFVDSASLPNEVMAFYRPYYTTNGTDWTDGPSAYGTPSATYEEHSTDALALLRDRLEAGLKVEVERGNFQTDLGYIQVYTAPPSLERDIQFPLVTVHLNDDAPEVRGIGENISGDEFDFAGFEWEESEGWLSNVQITVIGWSLNSDERLELHQALRRIVIGNLSVFADKGINQVAFSSQDVDAVNGEYGAPLYQVLSTFSCLAPTRVGQKVSSTVSQVTSRSINNG